MSALFYVLLLSPKKSIFHVFNISIRAKNKIYRDKRSTINFLIIKIGIQLIDRIAAKLKRMIDDVPVGFKWFVNGLLDSSLCFGREETAGATFSRLNRSICITDRDGFVPALLAAEITAKMKKDLRVIYNELTKEFGELFYHRI